MSDEMREAKIAITNDVGVVGWAAVSLIMMLALCVLIGPKAIGIAAVIGLAVFWKLNFSKRRLSKRFWWYCWFVILVLDVGLALYETQLALFGFGQS
jgi:hypothetical protein